MNASSGIAGARLYKGGRRQAPVEQRKILAGITPARLHKCALYRLARSHEPHEGGLMQGAVQHDTGGSGQ
jgi:hypothetical protein